MQKTQQVTKDEKVSEVGITMVLLSQDKWIFVYFKFGTGWLPLLIRLAQKSGH